MLTVSVKDFGPIKEGTVELKPLTIFVGPSNTGKSYMAGAVWALMKGFEEQSETSFLGSSGREPHSRRGRSPSPFQGTFDIDGANVKAINSFRNWIDLNWDSIDGKFKLQIPAFPPEVQTLLKQSTQQALVDTANHVVALLHYVHGFNQDIARSGITDSFSLTISENDPQFNLSIDLTGKNTLPPEVDLSRVEVPPPWDEIQGLGEGPGFSKAILSVILRILQGSVATVLFDRFPPVTYYLPSARSGMVESHKVLSAAVVRRSSRIRSGQQPVPEIPGITADFLGNLISLDPRGGNLKLDPPMDNAIRFIENEVLGGRVDLDHSGGLPLPDIAYFQGVGDAPEQKFHIHQASSMVSELAPVVLFLKYLVRPGDLLIFEEPESHLHPAAQRRLARGIARLVNAGVRVLITTHSDTFVSQINNLLGLGQASAGFISEHNLQPQEFLTLDQVGAYLFSIGQDGDGSGVRPLEIDPDTGIDEDEFAAVFEAIYEESIALQHDRS